MRRAALFMDPEEHDAYAAAVSHLPLVTSSALFASFWRGGLAGAGALASGGFQDTDTAGIGRA